jgi:hypothetical protein
MATQIIKDANSKGRRTALGDILKPLNSEYGKVAPGLGYYCVDGCFYGFICCIFESSFLERI